MDRKFNLLYEFITPIGFLGMGYNINSLPHIFEYLSNLKDRNNVKENSIVRYSSSHNYRLLQNGNDIYHTLMHCKEVASSSFLPKIERKLYTDLTTDELNNDINVFNIATVADEKIVDYITNCDLKEVFLPKTIDFIKNSPNVKIVLSDEREGGFYHDDSFFSSIEKFVKEVKLDTVQIVYLTNTADIKQQYDDYIKRNNTESFMVVHWIPFYILHNPGQAVVHERWDQKTNNLPESNLIVSQDELKLKRNFYFLNLNRNSCRYRYHRTDLILELKKKNLFNKGLVSLLQSEDFDNFCSLPGNEEFKKHIGDSYPYVLDEKDPDKVAHMNNYLMDKTPWVNTYFSVVNETFVEKEFIFITEKSIRPIINYHPFIILGNPHTLKHLKELGFQTFPEFFDESYDDISDYRARLSAVLDNISNLCMLSLDEIHEKYLSITDKLIHNHNLLIHYYTDQTIFKEVLTVVDR